MVPSEDKRDTLVSRGGVVDRARSDAERRMVRCRAWVVGRMVVDANDEDKGEAGSFSASESGGPGGRTGGDVGILGACPTRGVGSSSYSPFGVNTVQCM